MADDNIVHVQQCCSSSYAAASCSYAAAVMLQLAEVNSSYDAANSSYANANISEEQLMQQLCSSYAAAVSSI